MKPFSLLLLGVTLLSLSLAVAAKPPEHARGNSGNNNSANVSNSGKLDTNRGVCNELQGGTPGLYGLCVAFCEAQRCEPDLSLSDPFQSCRPSAQRLLDQYNRRKGAEDPAMPCVQQAEPCPCWSTQEIAGLRHPQQDDRTSCMNTASDSLWSINSSSGAYSTLAFGSTNSNRCFMTDQCQDGSCLGVTRNLEITPAQALACRTQAEMAGQYRALSCQ